MNRLIYSHLALILANAIYAINYILAKDVMPLYVSPKAFILIRVFGAGIIFFIIHFSFIKEKLASKDLMYLCLCALFGIVVNMLCFFEGLNLTTPINASLIMISTPVIVYVISLFFLKEHFTTKSLFGVMCGLLGASLLITNGNFRFSINNLGDFLVFINATSYAVYLILIKSMMVKYHPITVLKTVFIIGLLILLPITWSDFTQINFSIIPMNIYLKILYVVLFTTCGAYFLNIYAISNLKASSVAFYIYLQPLLATIISIIFGKDILTVIKLFSAILIFTGVYFVIKRH
ncbi:MAG: EamA family transporter [Flavobacteriales bacterium]|nr:EamA family transporter [Flavobacteriales bacterium]|tara:strand:+ start:14398 stop:15270 length:873 start_codon:yes stop_codon:yes gene_type:complete